MDYKELLEQSIREEETYVFSDFSRKDVWELGCALVQSASQMEGPIAVEIELNGTLVFRYYPEGTGKFHEQWLARKRNTVRVTEHSTMRIAADLKSRGVTMLEDMRLDPMDYADCGGGFPLRIRGGCVIGSIATSGLPDVRDNAALINGLKIFFEKHPQK